MGDIFYVIADPTRRELLRVLRERGLELRDGSGEVSVGGLVEALGLTQPTVSKHLKVLRESGLVSVREEGQHRYYRFESSPLEAVEDWLSPFLGSAAATEDAGSGATVFTAWAGSDLPKPLRRVAETIDQPAEAGTAVGRSVAEASHQVRSVLEGASHRLEEVSNRVEDRVVDPLRERWGKRGGTGQGTAG